MPDLHTQNFKEVVEIQSHPQKRERRAQPRSETVFGRIQDATYTILRKYEKKSA